MGAAAIRKIQIESPGFYQRFNPEYYRRINASPTHRHVSRGAHRRHHQDARARRSRACRPPRGSTRRTSSTRRTCTARRSSTGSRTTRPTTSSSFQDLYFLDTMSCGSEWACWDGTKWVYYAPQRIAGQRQARRRRRQHRVVRGAVDPAHAESVRRVLRHRSRARRASRPLRTLQPWPGGNTDDYVMNLTNARPLPVRQHVHRRGHEHVRPRTASTG